MYSFWISKLTRRYDREFFLQAGISHVDMYFDDGSNPTDEIVRAFIWLSEETIEERNMRVAVHCKAGLGRTGVLIGGKLTKLERELELTPKPTLSTSMVSQLKRSLAS